VQNLFKSSLPSLTDLAHRNSLGNGDLDLILLTLLAIRSGSGTTCTRDRFERPETAFEHSINEAIVLSTVFCQASSIWETRS